MLLHSILLSATAFFFLIFDSFLPLAFLATFSFFLLFRLQFSSYQSPGFLFEAANAVTTFRLLALLFLLFFQGHFSNFQIGMLFLCVLLADGLDGCLARRFGTASIFGAYLDAETDAFLVLLGSILTLNRGLLGHWILSIGLLRYVYFLLIFYLKDPRQPEKRFRFAKIIAVLLMSSFIGCFVLPRGIYFPAIVGASLLVLYSFAIGFADVLKWRWFGNEDNYPTLE